VDGIFSFEGEDKGERVWIVLVPGALHVPAAEQSLDEPSTSDGESTDR
jgi:6,7-dimethyl-8-ribityllumazine synthase